MLVTLVIVGFLVVNSLSSGQLQAREGDESFVLSFDFALKEGQEVRTIIWLKVVDGSPRTIYIYHGSGSNHPEPEYEGRILYSYSRTKTCQVKLLSITLTDAGQYICSLKLIEKASLVEPTTANTLTVLAANSTFVTANASTTTTSYNTTATKPSEGPLLLKATVLSPTTVAQSQELSPTTPAQSQELSPTTPAQSQVLSPTTPAQSQALSPTTAAQSQVLSPTTPAQSQVLSPTTPAQSQELSPTTPAKSQELSPTTAAKSQELSPTTAAQSPSLGSKEQQRNPDFESSMMSTITFSSTSTTAAIALLLLFLIIALYYRRRKRRKAELEYSNASSRAVSDGSEEVSQCTTSPYQVSTVQATTCLGFSGLDPPQRPPPGLPAYGGDGALCAPAQSPWLQSGSIASPATRYCVCPLFTHADPSYPAYPPPATCGLSRFPCLSTYTSQPYLDVSRVPYVCTGSHPGTDLKDSTLVETIV